MQVLAETNLRFKLGALYKTVSESRFLLNVAGFHLVGGCSSHPFRACVAQKRFGRLSWVRFELLSYSHSLVVLATPCNVMMSCALLICSRTHLPWRYSSLFLQSLENKTFVTNCVESYSRVTLKPKMSLLQHLQNELLHVEISSP